MREILLGLAVLASLLLAGTKLKADEATECAGKVLEFRFGEGIADKLCVPEEMTEGIVDELNWIAERVHIGSWADTNPYPFLTRQVCDMFDAALAGIEGIRHLDDACGELEERIFSLLSRKLDSRQVCIGLGTFFPAFKPAQSAYPPLAYMVDMANFHQCPIRWDDNVTAARQGG